MMKTSRAGAAAALCWVAFSGPAAAADAPSPADATQPVTTPRIGGSPADAALREARREASAVYNQARTECKAKPRAERGACMTAARAALKRAHLDADAAHAAAKKSR